MRQNRGINCISAALNCEAILKTKHSDKATKCHTVRPITVHRAYPQHLTYRLTKVGWVGGVNTQQSWRWASQAVASKKLKSVQRFHVQWQCVHGQYITVATGWLNTKDPNTRTSYGVCHRKSNNFSLHLLVIWERVGKNLDFSIPPPVATVFVSREIWSRTNSQKTSKV
jgi:hypothetical protein